MNKIISAEYLKSILQNPELIIIDASWYLPNDDKNGLDEYLKTHIAKAQFFNIDETHNLPSERQFQNIMQAIGVNTDSHIIVYDRIGYFSAPRVYWLLQYFGHEKVSILDGGFNAWKGKVEAGYSPAVAKGNFIAKEKPKYAVKKGEILAHLGSNFVLDARSEPRFKGTAPEPREGLRAGHIPHSKNIPYDKLFNKDTGEFKKPQELQKIMANILPADKSQDIICSCGSGITACTVILALQTLGYENTRLYDGSWAEWGADHSLPME